MKLILKKHLSGADGSFEAGSTIDVSENEAVAFIEKDIAGFKTKKELDDFMKKIESIKQKQAEDEAKVNAILRQSEIQNDLNALYLQVVEKEAELNGVVLNEAETVAAVESIAKREATKKSK